jgi:hypothetical protein
VAQAVARCGHGARGHPPCENSAARRVAGYAKCDGVTMTIGRKYVAFWSYTRFDDKNDDGWLTALREALMSEVQALFGEQVEIFQDLDGIAWGEQWKQKLVSSADDAVFLIPIITPSFFGSDGCRGELEQFVKRENDAGFKELILPIYYITTPQLQDQFKKASDLLAQTVADHNYEDIRELRHRSITSYEAKQKIEELAMALFERLRRYARKQLSSPAMRAHFTVPPIDARYPRKAFLSGTIENVPPGIDVWLVVENGPLYHPQGTRLPTDSGAFHNAPVTIGSDRSGNLHEFTVHALAVTEDISKSFSRYQQGSASFKKWAGVPKPAADSRVLATVKLVRDDSTSS